MSEKCCCPNPGWCQRHQMMKVGRLYELCKADTEEGAKNRDFWDKRAQTLKDKGISLSGPPITAQEKGQRKKGGCGCGNKKPMQNMSLTAKTPETPSIPQAIPLTQIDLPVENKKEAPIAEIVIEQAKPVATKMEIKPTPPKIDLKPSSTTAKKLKLLNTLCPGDVLVMSGAIECLHSQYKGQYVTDVRTSCDQIYENNPNITKLSDTDPDLQVIKMEYPLIDYCNQRPVHFIQGYVDYLADQLKIKLTCNVNKPSVYLSEEEKAWLPQVHEITNKPIKYWVINAGIKNDYTAKHWGYENYQKTVNLLLGKVQFVQVGEKHHNHLELSNVINLIGKTNIRQLIRLCYHAQGGFGPVTFLQHIFAALQKPYVCMLGGREPLSWEHYSSQTTMSTIGTLSCCKTGGCWVSRTVPLNDNDPKDKSLCQFPIFTSGGAIPKCLAMISPEDVVKAIERYYLGGVLSY